MGRGGAGIDDFVMVTLGTGIGGGVVADGELVRGRSGFAGEIGHMVGRGPRRAVSCAAARAAGSATPRAADSQRLTREAPSTDASRRWSPDAAATRGVRAEDVTAPPRRASTRPWR